MGGLLVNRRCTISNTQNLLFAQLISFRVKIKEMVAKLNGNNCLSQLLLRIRPSNSSKESRWYGDKYSV